MRVVVACGSVARAYYKLGAPMGDEIVVDADGVHVDRTFLCGSFEGVRGGVLDPAMMRAAGWVASGGNWSPGEAAVASAEALLAEPANVARLLAAIA